MLESITNSLKARTIDDVVPAGHRPRNFDGPENATEGEIRQHIQYHGDSLPAGLIWGLVGAGLSGVAAFLLKSFDGGQGGIFGTIGTLAYAGIAGSLGYAGYCWWNKVNLDAEGKGAVDESKTVTEKIDKTIKIALNKKEDVDLRLKAIYDLGTSNRISAIDPLKKILFNGKENDLLRGRAAASLGMLGVLEAAGDLLGCLNQNYRTSEEEVLERESSARTDGSPEEPAGKIQQEPEVVRLGAAIGLSHLANQFGEDRENIAKEIISFFQEKEISETAKAGLLQCIGQIGGAQAKAFLLENLKDLKFKDAAIQGLAGFADDKDVTKTLLDVLKNPGNASKDTICSVVTALQGVTDKDKQKEIIPELFKTLTANNNTLLRDTGVCRAVVQTFGQFGIPDKTGLKLLILLNERKDEELKAAVETAIKNMPPEKTAEVLGLEIVKNHSATSAVELCKHLGEHGVAPLLQGLSHKEPKVKEASLKALHEICTNADVMQNEETAQKITAAVNLCLLNKNEAVTKAAIEFSKLFSAKEIIPSLNRLVLIGDIKEIKIAAIDALKEICIKSETIEDEENKTVLGNAHKILENATKDLDNDIKASAKAACAALIEAGVMKDPVDQFLAILNNKKAPFDEKKKAIAELIKIRFINNETTKPDEVFTALTNASKSNTHLATTLAEELKTQLEAIKPEDTVPDLKVAEELGGIVKLLSSKTNKGAFTDTVTQLKTTIENIVKKDIDHTCAPLSSTSDENGEKAAAIQKLVDLCNTDGKTHDAAFKRLCAFDKLFAIACDKANDEELRKAAVAGLESISDPSACKCKAVTYTSPKDLASPITDASDDIEIRKSLMTVIQNKNDLSFLGQLIMCACTPADSDGNKNDRSARIKALETLRELFTTNKDNETPPALALFTDFSHEGTNYSLGVLANDLSKGIKAAYKEFLEAITPPPSKKAKAA